MSDANNCSVIFLLLLSFLMVKHFMSVGVHLCSFFYLTNITNRTFFHNNFASIDNFELDRALVTSTSTNI